MLWIGSLVLPLGCESFSLSFPSFYFSKTKRTFCVLAPDLWRKMVGRFGSEKYSLCRNWQIVREIWEIGFLTFFIISSVILSPNNHHNHQQWKLCAFLDYSFKLTISTVSSPQSIVRVRCFILSFFSTICDNRWLHSWCFIEIQAFLQCGGSF